MADQNPADYPIGTNAFPAFERNVENLDAAIVDRGSEKFPDRKGVQRYTYHGIEQRADRLLTGQGQQFDGFMVSSADQFQRFIEASGFSGWDRQYGPGIELNAHNEGFVRCEPDETACLFYTPRGDTPLPYTTTGDWSAESNLFVVQNGDAPLRQELSNPENELVGFTQGGLGAASFPMLQKSRQFLTGEDYYFNPDSGDVTEEGMRLYAIARERKKKVYLAAGIHKISGPIDPSGVATEGVLGGYRNNGGTIIDGSGDHHAFYQQSNSTDRITYSIKNIHIQNALSAVNLGYAVFTELEHISATNVKQGIILSNPVAFGSLWNVMRQLNIVSLEEALIMDGGTVANANLLDTCLFNGGTEPVSIDDYIPASRITASGGYGALATTLINTEITGPGVGLELMRGSSTLMLNPYFESKACSLSIKGPAGKVKVVGGVFGSARNEHPTPNAFIWHRSGATSLDIDGLQIFLDQSGDRQNDMRLIHSDSPGSLTTNMMIPPRVSNTVGATGWRLFGDGLPTSLGYMNYSDTFTPTLSAASGTTPSVGSGGISGSYTRAGKQIHVDIELVFGSGFSATGNNWLISLPFNSVSRAIGNARIFRSGHGVKSGICIVNSGSRSLSVYTSENPSPVGGGIPWSWQAGDVISLSIDYGI